jgi:hypothetical protein
MPSDAQLRDEVLACAERTLAAPSARIEFCRDWSFEWQMDRRRGRRRGGLLRPLGRLAKATGKAVLRVAWRRLSGGKRPGHMCAEGFIEPPVRRHMIDFGAFAEVRKEGKRWGGASGRPIATLDPWPPDRQIDLWWLLDVLRGTAAATVEGEETLYGVSCRRVGARVDLSRTPTAAVPSVERFEDLLALPITVWIDGEHVRRVQFTEGDTPSSTLTVNIPELDPPVSDLDWNRLPTFRTAAEEGWPAG